MIEEIKSVWSFNCIENIVGVFLLLLICHFRMQFVSILIKEIQCFLCKNEIVDVSVDYLPILNQIGI